MARWLLVVPIVVAWQTCCNKHVIAAEGDGTAESLWRQSQLMFNQVIRERGTDTAGKIVCSNPRQCKCSPGTYVVSMGEDILAGQTAFYRVEGRNGGLRVPLLSRVGIQSDDFGGSVIREEAEQNPRYWAQ